MGLSSFASKPVEDVVAANPKTFFQVYWLGGRDAIAARVERARAAGAVGLIATTDWSFAHGRDWGSPKIPEHMDLRTTVRMLPEGLTRPRWFLQWAKTMRPPNLRVPNQAPRGEPGPPFFAAYGEWMATPPPTWEDIAWLRELGAVRSCSRVSCAWTTPNVLSTKVFRRFRCLTMVGTT